MPTAFGSYTSSRNWRGAWETPRWDNDGATAYLDFSIYVARKANDTLQKYYYISKLYDADGTGYSAAGAKQLQPKAASTETYALHATHYFRYAMGHSAYTKRITAYIAKTTSAGKVDGSELTFSFDFGVPAKASYWVGYNANGGSSTPSGQTKWFNENITLAGAISRNNASAGSYTVTLNGNGASNPSALSAARTTKYTFSSWKASNGTTYAKSATYSANAATTMTAQWSSSTTTAAVTLPTPSRSGFNWVRWNTNNVNTGTGYSGGSSYTPSGNVTLYAIWNHTLTYNLNGGSGTFNAQTALATSAITLNSGQPTRTNYTFKRWNTNTSDTGTGYNPGGSFAAQTANTTIYAIWNRTVTYNANGGTGAPAAQTAVDTSPITLSTAKPTLTDHMFIEWNTASDGSGNTYASGQTYPANNPNVTLYAIWGPQLSIDSVVRTDSTGAPDDFGGCVKVTLSVKAQESYQVSVGSVSVNPIPETEDGTYTVIVPGTLETFDPRMAYTVTVSATDSENRTSTVTRTLPATSYAKPKVNSILVQRCTSDGNPDDSGNFVLLSLDWTGYYAPSQEVVLSLTSEDEDGGVHTYNDETLVAPGGFTTFVYPSGTDVLPSFQFDTEKLYHVSIRITDKLDYGVAADTLSRAYFTMDVIGNAYLYQPSEDTVISADKPYFKPIDRRTAPPTSTMFLTTAAISGPLLTLSPVYGATMQDGTPTPTSPKPISCVRGIFDGENILPAALNASSWSITSQPSGSNMAVSDYETGTNFKWTAVGGYEVFRLTSGITVEAGKWYKLKCKYNVNLAFGNRYATHPLGLSVRDSTSDSTEDSSAYSYLGVAPFQTETGETLETSVVFRATASTVYLYVNGGMATDNGNRDVDVYDIELTSESIAIVSETEGSDPITVYLDLQGNELNALNDVYRDTLSIDENGRAIITKRTATIGLEGLTGYETVGSYKAVTHTFASNRKIYYPDGNKIVIAKSNYFSPNQWIGSWYPDKIFVDKANNKVYFTFDSSFAADLNAAKIKLSGFTFIYPLEESSWYTVDLGPVILPQVVNNSVVHVEAEIQPVIGGSWLTSSGTAKYGSEAYEKVNPYWSGWNNIAKSTSSSVAPTDYRALRIDLEEWLEADQTYTLQIWDVDVSHSAKSDTDLGVAVYYCGGNVTFGGWYGEGRYFEEGHADHLSMTFTPHETTPAETSTAGEHSDSEAINALNHASVSSADSPFFYIYNSVPNAAGTMNLTVGSWKLEKGSEPTDWTPCLSDVSPSDQGWYEKSGPKPGHGVSFGAPAMKEAFNIAMPPECYGEPWVPTFKTSSIANFVAPTGVEECLVDDVSNEVFYHRINGSYVPINFPYKETGPIDANTCAPGFYQVRGSITNAPITSHGVLLYFNQFGIPFQLYMPDNQPYAYKRWYTSGAWTSWTPFSSTIPGYVTSATNGSTAFISKDTGVDLSKTNNNLASGAIHYPCWYAVDNADRTIARVEGRVHADGRVGFYLYARNYNTSGSYTGQKGISIWINKNGTSTYAVDDAANFRTAIGAAASSDRRLKDHICYIGKKAVDFVKSLKPAVFDRHGGGETHREMGFYAQDVRESDIWETELVHIADPDKIHEDERFEDGTLLMDYKQLIAPLVAAVQDLTQRVENLEKKLGE